MGNLGFRPEMEAVKQDQNGEHDRTEPRDGQPFRGRARKASEQQRSEGTDQPADEVLPGPSAWRERRA